MPLSDYFVNYESGYDRCAVLLIIAVAIGLSMLFLINITNNGRNDPYGREKNLHKNLDATCCKDKL